MMATTRVVHIDSCPGGRASDAPWRSDPAYVYIGRSGKGLEGPWGNPHNVGRPCNECSGATHTREEAIDVFRKQNFPVLKTRRGIEWLRGKTLVCFCKPLPCHGDVFAEYFNETETGTPPGTQFGPRGDGVDHINIYSHGATEVGRWMSNFTREPILTEDGPFESIEGYWYWLRTGEERLRALSGWVAKKCGREAPIKSPPLTEEEFRRKVTEAIRLKAEKRPDMMDRLMRHGDLPLVHYYVHDWKVIQAGHQWVVDAWSQLREEFAQKKGEGSVSTGILGGLRKLPECPAWPVVKAWGTGSWTNAYCEGLSEEEAGPVTHLHVYDHKTFQRAVERGAFVLPVTARTWSSSEPEPPQDAGVSEEVASKEKNMSIEDMLGAEPSNTREEAVYTPPDPKKMTRKPGFKVYAGIGSRGTPPEILSIMEKIGEKMAREGWFLRSGNARGADQAFARGANRVDPKRVILYLPWPSFEREAIVTGNTVVPGPSMAAQDLMARILGPQWLRISQGVQKLFARDLHQIYGKGLNWPADLVICWTPGGMEVGGTAIAIRAARSHGDIPVANLANKRGRRWSQKVLALRPGEAIPSLDREEPDSPEDVSLLA